MNQDSEESLKYRMERDVLEVTGCWLRRLLSVEVIDSQYVLLGMLYTYLRR